MKQGVRVWIFVILNIVGAFGEEGPPQYGYDNLPETRFTCEGKLQGRYYADSETDCQMFHVCVRMSKKEIQDYRFLCPNGTVFDQEHLVCADYFQVACHAHINEGAFGHIFEFLKLSASKDAALDYGKVPSKDPEYLGRNTLNDDFQVEEYNNNKLAAQGNSLQYSQNLQQKEIRFPTTTTRRTTTTRPPTTRYSPTTTSTTTTTTTTTAAPPTTTTASPYYTESFPSEETYGTQSTVNYQNNNFNFHRETDVPQSFPTTTSRRPDYFPGSNFGFNDQYTTTTTYAPPTTTNTINNNNYRDTTTDFRFTTTRRPVVFQSTFRTSLDAITSTQSPFLQSQKQQTFQQQSSRFGDDYFRKIPTTEQSTTTKTQFLFYGETADPKQSTTTYSPITQTTFRNNNNDYYTTTTTQDYFPQQGRSINSGPFIKTDRPKQFATKATPAPQFYTSTTTPAPASISYYEPTKAPYQAPQYVEEQRYSETTFPTTTTTTTTTTARPVRRGGRRRVNPNRPRNNPGQPRNFDPQVKYSRRTESATFNERETFGSQQKTEEIFNAEASVFRGPPRGNNFYVEQARQPKEQDSTTVGPKKTIVTFGGENFGRRIRPGKQTQFQPADSEFRKSTKSTEETKLEVAVSSPRPDSGRVVKRLRQKSTTEASTTISYQPQPFNPSSTTTSAPAPASPSPAARVIIRTKTVSGRLPAGVNPGSEENNGSNKRRIIVKKLRPVSTAEPRLETAAPAGDNYGASTPSTNNNNYNSNNNNYDNSFTTFKVEEVQTPGTTERPAELPTSNYKRNLTATVGGFKVTVISKSSDQQTSTSNAQELTTPHSIQPHHVFKPKLPKLDKKLIAGQQQQPLKQQVSSVTSTSVSSSSKNNNNNNDKAEEGVTKSPDYDYQYYNSDDESQYVAEQNSQDRLFGKKARNKAIAF